LVFVWQPRGIDFSPPAGSEVSLPSKLASSGELRSAGHARDSGGKPLVGLLLDAAVPTPHGEKCPAKW